MRRIIFITIVIAALIAIIFYVDFGTIREAVTGLDRQTLLIVFGLLMVSSIVKSLRWAFYLRAAKLDISWKDGMTTYLAGMSAGALPGGSWLAPRLAQEHGNVRMREAAAGLFVGFVVDMIAISILAWAAMFAMRLEGPRFLIPTAGILLASLLIAMGRSERLWYAVDRFLARWRLTRSWLPKEADIHQRVSALMRPNVIARGICFSFCTTILSAAILLTLVEALTYRGISPLEALYVLAASENAAIVIAVPGGIGVSDSSLVGLLNSLSIGWVRASFIALTIRSLDILFKTTVGTVFLLTFYNRLLRSVLQVRRRARRAYRFGYRWTVRGLRVTGLHWLARVRHVGDRASQRSSGPPSPPTATAPPDTATRPAPPTRAHHSGGDLN